MTIRFNLKAATLSPTSAMNLVTAGVGAADETLTSIGQVLQVPNPLDLALAAPFTNATLSMAATNLSVTLATAASYRIRGCFQVSNSVAAEGGQLDFNGGGGTVTTFFVATRAAGSVVVGTETSTSLAGVINYTTITGTCVLLLSGYVKVNNGGTFIIRAAENTHSTGTFTMGAGSWVSYHNVTNG